MDAWYYVKDGRQNGPLPLGELIALYATGTLGPQDLVWRQGMDGWKAAEEVPELKRAAAAPPPLPPAGGQASLNPYQSPASDWSKPPDSQGEPSEEIVPGSQVLPVGAILSRSWELTKRHFPLILGAGLVYFLLSYLARGIDELVTQPFVTGHTPEGDPILSAPGQVVAFVDAVVIMVIDIFLTLGLTRIGLNLVSGKPAEFRMLFGEGGKLVNAVAAYILYGLMVLVGLILLVVPGIYLALRFGQFYIAIVDKNLGPIEALQYSSRITAGNKWNLLGLGIVCFFIVLGGVLALLVGLIVALPVVTMASYVAYRWLQYGQAAIQDPAPPSGPR